VAYLLARPYSFVGYHYAQAMGRGILDAGFLLAEGFAVGFLFAGAPPGFAAWRLALLLPSLLVAGSVQFFLQISIAMTAFWIEENSAFFWIFQKFALIIGTFVPLEFLPGWAQRAAWWTPLPSLNYAPARILVAADPLESAGLIAVQLAWAAACALLAKLVFEAGRSKLTVQGG
jgi:ABC-2 type transport system permease protein